MAHGRHSLALRACGGALNTGDGYEPSHSLNAEFARRGRPSQCFGDAAGWRGAWTKAISRQGPAEAEHELARGFLWLSRPDQPQDLLVRLALRKHSGPAAHRALAYLVAGDPVSADVWLTPAGKERMWVPVWLAWLAFLAWPLTALAIKRLHDRDRPQWLWYAYYCMTIVFSLPPLKNMTGADLGPAASAMMLSLLMFGLYVFSELAVLRGTPGPNGHGEDTLPAGYSGGDYSFLSLMLAWEGRISRAKWWLGILIVSALYRRLDSDDPCDRCIQRGLSRARKEYGKPGLDQ